MPPLVIKVYQQCLEDKTNPNLFKETVSECRRELTDVMLMCNYYAWCNANPYGLGHNYIPHCSHTV